MDLRGGKACRCCICEKWLNERGVAWEGGFFCVWREGKKGGEREVKGVEKKVGCRVGQSVGQSFFKF